MAMDDWLRTAIYTVALVWMATLLSARVYPSLRRLSVQIDTLPESVQRVAYIGVLGLMIVVTMGIYVVVVLA